MTKTKYTMKEAVEFLERKEKRANIKALWTDDPEQRRCYEDQAKKARELRAKFKQTFCNKYNRATLTF